MSRYAFQQSVNQTLRHVPAWRNNLTKASRRLRKPLGFSLLWQKPKVRHSSGMIGRYASYILRVGFMPAAVSSGVDRP